jgi:hypothetical protein
LGSGALAVNVTGPADGFGAGAVALWARDTPAQAAAIRKQAVKCRMGNESIDLVIFGSPSLSELLLFTTIFHSVRP